MIRGNEVNYKLALDEWDHLLKGEKLSKDQVRDARNFKAGLYAEKEMAYYLNAEFGGHPSLMVFNNLKIEHRGLTAQIDHLVLSRWAAYFIETKSASHEININGDGQWARVYRRKYTNMESPLEESRRHETRLFELLEANISEFMGKILGVQTYFRNIWKTRHYVAVPVKVKISGKGKKQVAEHLWPADQICRAIADDRAERRQGIVESLLGDNLSKKEFEGVCQLIEKLNISKTPLQQVHEFIAELGVGPEDIAAEPPPTEREPAIPRVPIVCEATPVKNAGVVLPPIPVSETSPDEPTDRNQNPLCPKCESPMELRTARRGDRKGKPFYGCSKYPKCRGIINID